MCIIVSKKKGINLPGKDILKNCFDYNSDGSGLMFNDGTNVYIEKGFMTFNDFYNRLMELDKEYNLINSDLVMHFRISTSGNIDPGNCHPYKISNIDTELRELKTITNIGMVHNGVIKNHIPPQGSILNDTQTFIKNYVYNMYTNDIDFLTKENNINMLGTEAGSKLCFLTKDNMYIIGHFIEDNNILYSNESYTYYNDFYSWEPYTNYEYEFDFNYFDLFDVEGVPLDFNEFISILDNVDFITCRHDKENNNYYDDTDIVIYKNKYMFEVDYTLQAFNYICDCI